MTVQRADTFARANVSGGWGTATDGNAWNVGAGSSTLSVTSDEGIIASSSASSFLTLGGSLATADGEALFRFARADTTNTIGTLLRWTDSNNFYLSFLDGSGNLKLYKKVAGTATVINALTFSTTANTFYWMRFRVQGTTLEQRVWQDGTAEPSAWTYSATDTSLSGSGGSANSVGLYGYSNGLDNSYDSYQVDDLATGGVALAGESDGVSTASAALTVSHPLSGASNGVATASASLSVPQTLAGASNGISTASAALTAGYPGTGIGDLIVSTKSQTWSGGPAGSPGTETDLTYTDPAGDGWAVGLIPTYGGLALSSWYEVASGAQGVNQTSLTTNAPDGRMTVDVQSSGGVYTSSESTPFTLTELAPTGTAFRRYYQGAYGPDANGLNWRATVCVYPGDPGLLVTRFDLINPGGSPLALNASDDSIEVALIQGMQVADATWNYLNGGYGTVGGANVTPWPTASANGNPVSADPDYVYITPAASGGSTTIGQVTVKQQPTTAYAPAWSSPQLAVLLDSVHLKIKVFGDLAAIPASSTSTFYFLNALRRNLTAADAAAIAADYLAPGTPTVTSGSYTSYSYDEGVYLFAATGSGPTAALATTLDLSPAHVTTRYKPRLKITGWTGGEPALTWGGAALVNGVDYRHYVDTSTDTLYVQLYYDVVASGAGHGQRNNAALSITPAWVGTSAGVSTATATLTVAHALVGASAGASTASASLTVAHSLVGESDGVATASAALTVSHPLAGASSGVSTASATLLTGHGLSGESDGVSTASAALTINHNLGGASDGVSTASATLTHSVPLAGESDGQATASATLDVGAPPVQLAGLSAGQSTAVAILTIAQLLAGVAAGVSTASASLSVGIIVPPPPSGVSVALATAGPIGAAVALALAPGGVSVIGD